MHSQKINSKHRSCAQTMATSTVSSAVFPLPIEIVWQALRDFTFPKKLLPSIVQDVVIEDGKSPFSIGSVRLMTWRSGETARQRSVVIRLHQALISASVD